MNTKRFILVLRNRKDGRFPYVSDKVYVVTQLSRLMVHLDSIGVDVVDIISVDVDLSVYG